MERGKTIYKSTSLRVIKLICTIIIVTLFVNLYFKAKFYYSLEGSAEYSFALMIDYYLKYPHHLIFYFLFVFIPSVYYGFIRGVTFFEQGVLINRGFPFFNFFIPYNLIQSFDVIKDNFFISLKRKDTEDEYLVTITNMDRALAILDQNGIKGHLGQPGTHGRNNGAYKIIIFLVIAGIICYTLEKLIF